jgi:toxin ParE1/3/4
LHVFAIAHRTASPDVLPASFRRGRGTRHKGSLPSSPAETAERVLAEIEHACLGLEELPERGNIPKELVAIGISEYRELHHKPWRLIYRIIDADVIVYCMVDGRRDMQSFLERRLLRCPSY